MFNRDEGAKYMRLGGGVKGCRKRFSTPPAKHVSGQEMNLLNPLPIRLTLRRAAFGATASDLAAAAVKGLPSLVNGEDQAKPHGGENQKMLAPERHDLIIPRQASQCLPTWYTTNEITYARPFM